MNHVHPHRSGIAVRIAGAVLTCLVAFTPAFSKATSKDKAIAVEAKPLEQPGRWFSADDYPVAASLDGLEGRTAFKLEIDVGGRVSSCLITISSGLEMLDETACAILKQRARFSPALDRRNVPMVGSYSGRINWRLPENNALRIAEFPKRLHISYDVDEEGAVENCSVKENVGNATYVKELGKAVDSCEVLMHSNRLQPVIDADGNMIAAHVETINETLITPR